MVSANLALLPNQSFDSALTDRVHKLRVVSDRALEPNIIQTAPYNDLKGRLTTVSTLT